MHATDLLDNDTLRELRDMLGANLDPVIDQFAQQVQELVAQMTAAVQQGDLPGVRTLAHKLKGSAGSVGARALSAEATQLERAVATLDVEGITSRLESLPPLAAATVHALHAVRGTA